MGDPIWQILEQEGRRQSWLAEKIGYPDAHVSRVKHSVIPATPTFRSRCAEVLGRPESDLFHAPEPTPSSAATEREASESHEVLTSGERR